MPTPLALALISLMGLLAVLALSVMSHGIWVVSSLYRHGWRLRWPFYNVHRVERSLYNGDGQIPTQTKSDAVNHIVVEGRVGHDLNVNYGAPGKPVLYPVHLRNTRPLHLSLISYSAVFYWCNDPIGPEVSWIAPQRRTSNGYAVEPVFAVGPDSPTLLRIPFFVQQAKPSPPGATPLWGVRIELVWQGDDDQPFNMSWDLLADPYQLSDSNWQVVAGGAATSH